MECIISCKSLSQGINLKRLENVLYISKKKVFDIDDFKELKSFYKRLIKFTQEFKYEEVGILLTNISDDKFELDKI